MTPLSPPAVGRRGASLEWKLTGIIFALAFVISASLAIYLPARQVTRLRAELDHKALTLGRLTSHQVESAIAFRDRETAREVFESIMLDPDVNGLALLTDNGSILYSSGTVGSLDGLGPSTARATPRLAPYPGVVRAVAAVAAKEGPRGTVVVDLTPASLEAERTVLFYTAASVGLLALLVGSVAAWLIARSVAQRVKRLAIATTRVADGDLTCPVLTDSSKDEIGQLSRAFQHMLASIQSLVAQVADQAKQENERLEVLVQARTSELDSRNVAMRLVLDNMGQGFVTVDKVGTMSKERSAILDTWLGVPEEGMTFGDYIGLIDSEAGARFVQGWEQVADDVLPIELIIDQLPNAMRHGERHFQLQYILLGRDAADPSLLAVVSDVTAEIEQRRAEEGRRDLASLFDRVLTDRAAVVEFFAEADDLMAKIEGTVGVSREELLRALHTLKGNAHLMALSSVGRLCHELEDRLVESEGIPTRANLEELQRAWRLFSGASRSLLGERSDRLELEPEEYRRLLAAAQSAPRSELVRQVQGIALEPTSRRLHRVADQARALADRLGKPGLAVSVESHGVRLPPTVWAPFWSAFVHVVRNAVDHGIESPDERVDHGKTPAGSIHVQTSLGPDEMCIELTDDGRGIDWDAVARGAKREGYRCETQADLEAALFRHGVSTAQAVTDISGRGVGLGAVREVCEALGGRIVIQSTAGAGSSFQFRFPVARSRPASSFPVARASMPSMRTSPSLRRLSIPSAALFPSKETHTS